MTTERSQEFYPFAATALLRTSLQEYPARSLGFERQLGLPKKVLHTFQGSSRGLGCWARFLTRMAKLI